MSQTQAIDCTVQEYSEIKQNTISNRLFKSNIIGQKYRSSNFLVLFVLVRGRGSNFHSRELSRGSLLWRSSWLVLCIRNVVVDDDRHGRDLLVVDSAVTPAIGAGVGDLTWRGGLQLRQETGVLAASM